MHLGLERPLVRSAQLATTVHPQHKHHAELANTAALVPLCVLTVLLGKFWWLLLLLLLSFFSVSMMECCVEFVFEAPRSSPQMPLVYNIC